MSIENERQQSKDKDAINCDNILALHYRVRHLILLKLERCYVDLD